MSLETNLLNQVFIEFDGNQPYWEKGDVESFIKPQTIWNPDQYLNMWTTNFGGINELTLGYAQFPNLSGLDGIESNEGLASTDGVVMGYKYFGRVGNIVEPYDGGRTTTHEVGHWLGLKHIWGDGDCSVDDFCADTPRSSGSNGGCRNIDSCPSFSGMDMTENYMDYSDDACMNIFTQDQKTRMLTVMNNSPRRKELLNSTVHLATNSPFAYFTSSRTQICSGESIDFTDASVNSPTSWEWVFTNSDEVEVGSFSDQNPSLVFNGIGNYNLLFVVTNSLGSDTLYYPNYVSVLSSEELSLPFIEDFETVNTLENWVFYNPDNDRTWQETNVADAGSGSFSVVIDNYSDVDGDPSGTLDALISPSIDLSTTQDVYLSFDVAYAKFNTDYTDTLAVYVSIDCGENFTPIWAKGGNDLATAADTQSSFVPSNSSSWFTEKVPLIDFNGQSNVHIAIVNISGWGNNLFLDNITIARPSYTDPSFTLFSTLTDTVSVGSTVHFWDNSQDYPTAWEWEFEGASILNSNEQNPVVSYDSIGSFNVKLTTTNMNGGDYWLRADYITVVDKPSITTISNRTDNKVCMGEEITVFATGGIYYKWFNERGDLISEDRNLSVSPRSTTTYRVEGYDLYGGFSTEEVPVTVNSLPSTSLGENVTITKDESIILEAEGGFSTYQWSNGSSSQSINISGGEYEIGEHELIITVSNSSGCKASDTIQINVLEADPEVAVRTSISNSTVCKGESISLFASGGSRYEWYDEKGVLISEKDTVSVAPQSNTSYKLIGFNQSGMSDITETKVNVISMPEVDLGADVNITETDSIVLKAGELFASYLWNDGNTTSTRTIYGRDYGIGKYNISVKVSNEAGCTAVDTLTLTIDRVTSISERSSQTQKAKVFPIPAHDYINLIFSKAEQGTILHIYDLNGVLLISREVTSDHSLIDIRELRQGIYISKLIYGKKTETLKIIKSY